MQPIGRAGIAPLTPDRLGRNINYTAFPVAGSDNVDDAVEYIYKNRQGADYGFVVIDQLPKYTTQLLRSIATRIEQHFTLGHLTIKAQPNITMKVLLLGATGNLGSRLVPALLTHGHSVVVYVRSVSKLESLIPATVYEQITIVQGDATDSQAIKKAIIGHKCEAVVSTAGVAALAPWAKSDLPVIFKAVLDAVREAGAERGSPLRVWFLGGQGVLYYPGTQSMLSN